MVVKVRLPSQEVLKQHFVYDRETARLIWRDHPKQKSRNGACAECGHKSGYRRVSLCGHVYYAHRVIYVLFHGDIPDGFHVDHINCDVSDNRIENLRLATNSQNMANAKLCRGNASGIKGVCKRHYPYNPWQAQIVKDGIHYHIGCFPTAEEAAEAYMKKAREFFGEFARAS
jgi:hypothetical protein